MTSIYKMCNSFFSVGFWLVDFLELCVIARLFRKKKFLDHLRGVSLVLQLFSQFRQNLSMYRLVSDGIMDSPFSLSLTMPCR